MHLFDRCIAVVKSPFLGILLCYCYAPVFANWSCCLASPSVKIEIHVKVSLSQVLVGILVF